MTDTLSFCGSEEAITRMNRFGCEGRPFFFLIDYTAEKCLVEEPHRLPSAELLFASILSDRSLSKEELAWLKALVEDIDA